MSSVLQCFLTVKMENLISKLRNFSKLDIQSKQELINVGRPASEQMGNDSFFSVWYSLKTVVAVG